METVLEETGPCGPFQVCHVTLVLTLRFVAAWAANLMVFGLLDPGWRCDHNTNGSTVPEAVIDVETPALRAGKWQGNITHSPFSDSNSSYGNESLKITPGFYNYNGTCDVIDSCVRVEFNPSSSTIVTEFGLHCHKVWVGHLLVSVGSGGQLVGAFFWGQFGETFGKKRCLYLSTLIMLISSGFAVLSPIWEVYAFFLFWVGFGMVYILSMVYVLCWEFLNAKWRGRLTSIPVFNFGVISFALVTFVLRDWRHVHLATACVMALTCLGYFWVPESLRWLVIHGKTAEAQKVVRKIATVNKKPITEERLEQAVNANANADDDKERHYTYLDLFRTREIRFLTAVLTLIRFVSMFIYEMIAFAIQSLPGDFYTNVMTASLVELPFALACGPLANRMGRRRTGILLMATGLVCSSSVIVSLLTLEGDGGLRDTLMTTFAFVGKSAMYASMLIHALVVTELIPTAVRNVSFGFYNTVSRIVCLAGAFLLPTDDRSMIVFFAVFVGLQIAAAAGYWALQETKDTPLKDTLRERKKCGATVQISVISNNQQP